MSNASSNFKVIINFPPTLTLLDNILMELLNKISQTKKAKMAYSSRICKYYKDSQTNLLCIHVCDLSPASFWTHTYWHRHICIQILLFEQDICKCIWVTFSHNSRQTPWHSKKLICNIYLIPDKVPVSNSVLT